MTDIVAPPPTLGAPKPRFAKVLRGFDLTLFTVCAILVIDQLSASASIGAQSIFWCVFTLVLFFIPYGLITSESGSSLPHEGGIYSWVRRAFGPLWAGRTAQLWWVNVAFWMPSVYILFAGILAQLVFSEMSLLAKMAITFGLIWLTVAINIVTLEVGKWVPNIGALFKVIIMLVIGVGGIVFAMRHGIANEFSVRTMTPSWGANLAFLPVVLYNFLGFELMSSATEEMKDPARDVPRSILISGLLISFFYIFATVGILLALPAKEIGLIDGLIDTFKRLFGSATAGATIVTILASMALYTLVANMVTWTIGANRSAAEAAKNGDLPAIFAKMHPRFKTPTSSAVVGGVIGTVVLIIYGYLAKSAEDLFWSTFAFSSVVFLLPYFLLFGSLLKLRRTEPDLARPGGYPVAVILSVICIAFIAQGIIFLIYKPGAFTPIYAASILGGMLVTIAIGEVLVRASIKHTNLTKA